MNYRHLWLENGASTLSMAIKVTCLRFTCRLLPTLPKASKNIVKPPKVYINTIYIDLEATHLCVKQRHRHIKGPEKSLSKE